MTASSCTALVTGGGKGIGRAISEELALRGWNVVVTGRDEKATATAVKEIGNHVTGVRLEYRHLDVRSREEVQAVFSEVSSEIGPISVLVNCAGVIARGPADELDDEAWNTVVDTDVTGVFRCCRAAFPDLSVAGEGAIVNVGSVAALVGLAGRVSYTTSKAALDGLTRTLAVEWAHHGIRVNTVAPGWTLTEMVVGGIASGALNEEELKASIPQRRLARPDEIAKVVGFLASSDASYITGQSVVVDGGYVVNGGV